MKKLFASVMAISMLMVLAPQAHAVVHPVGTNIKDSSGTIYTITPEGSRRAYSSGGAFLSYGFNTWGSVKPATPEDLALPVGSLIPPQDGKIMCDTKHQVGTCFLITGGMKVAFPSEAVFKGQGFKFSRAMYGDVSFLNEHFMINSAAEAHRAGVLVKKNNTLYLVTPYGLMGFSSMDVFKSWGYNVADVVTANTMDNTQPIIGNVPYRNAGEFSPLNVYGPVQSNQPENDNGQSSTNYGNNTLPYPTAGLSSFSPTGPIQTGNEIVLAEFEFKAPVQGSLVITQINLKFGGSVNLGYLSNLKLYHFNDQKVVGDNAGYPLSYDTIGLSINPPITITNGQNAYVMVKADVNSAAAGSTINVALTQTWQKTSYGTTELTNFTNLPITSNTVTFEQTAPSFTVTAFVDTSKPYATSVTPGQQKVTLGTIGVKNNGTKDMAFGYADLSVTSTMSPAISTFYVLDSYGNQLIKSVSSSSDSFNQTFYNDFKPSAVIPAGQTKYFTMQADISPNAYGEFTLKSAGVGYDYDYAQPTKVEGSDNFQMTIKVIGGTASNIGNSGNRDSLRLAQVKQLASALELYLNDKNSYPVGLGQLTPNYIGMIPNAPTPTDGICNSTTNNYNYALLNSYTYSLSFCLGGSTGGYSAGTHILTPYGIQ